jgi:hypothetical protein
MEQNNRILTRDLKAILSVALAMTKDPGTAERLLALAERAEKATEQFMAEQHELRCMKDEHRQFLSRAGKEHDERLAMERLAWEREVAEARKRLQRDEDATARRRESVNRDKEVIAALRERLARKVEKAGLSLPPAAIPSCDSVIEQQPTAA